MATTPIYADAVAWSANVGTMVSNFLRASEPKITTASNQLSSFYKGFSDTITYTNPLFKGASNLIQQTQSQLQLGVTKTQKEDNTTGIALLLVVALVVIMERAK